MKELILLLIPTLIFAQTTQINYATPRTNTVPFYNNDKQEIRAVVNNNATTLGQLDAQIDLLNGGAIRTITKAVPVNGNVNFFSIASANGVISLNIQVSSDNIAFQVSKTITLNYAKGNPSFMAQSTGSFNGHDFGITYVPILTGTDVVGFTFQVNNKSLTQTAQITLTMVVGGLSNNLTYTPL